MNVEVYWNEDKTEYAVLVSRGYGAGFSSWQYHAGKEIAYDKRVVEWFIEKCKDFNWKEQLNEFTFGENNAVQQEARNFLESLGYESPSIIGLGDCVIEWVPRGVIWRMNEYDGAESIVYQAEQDWVCY